MKETTLGKSLNWLKEKSITSLEDVRDYINVYTQVKDTLHNSSYGKDKYRNLNNKLPEIVYKEFNNPYYLLKTYLYNNLSIKNGNLQELFPNVDVYPAKTKYFNEISNQIRNINKIISDFM